MWGDVKNFIYMQCVRVTDLQFRNAQTKGGICCELFAGSGV
jgi:hypothetical protein